MNTLIIFYPGCNDQDLIFTTKLLHAYGEIKTCTENGKDFESTSGLFYKVDYSFSNVDLSKMSYVLIPDGDINELKKNIALKNLLINCSRKHLKIGCLGNSIELINSFEISDSPNLITSISKNVEFSLDIATRA